MNDKKVNIRIAIEEAYNIGYSDGKASFPAQVDFDVATNLIKKNKLNALNPKIEERLPSEDEIRMIILANKPKGSILPQKLEAIRAYNLAKALAKRIRNG